MIKILSVGRNVEKYIPSLFESIQCQTLLPDSILIVLDDPTDNSFSAACDCRISTSIKFNILLNDDRKHQPRNFYEGIHGMLCEDDDIIAIVDCDDTITCNALNIINSIYSDNPDCLLTYGTYHRSSRSIYDLEFQGPYLSSNFRQVQWKASHLKTFKYKLFKHLQEKDFMYDDGKTWFTRTGDQALMLPMLEMAGLDRTHYVCDVIYNLTDHSSEPGRYSEPYPSIANGKHVHEIIRSRQPKDRVKF